MIEVNRIGGVPVDATINEQHTDTYEPTKNPVEGSADVSDHILRQPKQLSLTGVVTNAPLSSDDVAPARAEDLFQRLRDVAASKQPIDVETSLGTYHNMVLASIAATREGEDAVNFVASLQEIIIVGVDVVQLEVPDQVGQPKTERGAQPVQEIDASQAWHIFFDN